LVKQALGNLSIEPKLEKGYPLHRPKKERRTCGAHLRRL
jgi:hypothetical protein